MATTPELDPRLVAGLSVYQDVVLDGHTVLKGARDCQLRWDAIAPHLPASGCFLDVGSNFGWFGLKLCEAPDRVVASVEADERSATVQRTVLASHRHERVCLLTARAGVRLARTFAAAGQRFDAALVLSVLHWIPDHREFLREIGSLTDRLFVEQPDPREAGAGVERLRREIGCIGPYLGELFPERPVVCLQTWRSHRATEHPRELWMVGEPLRGDQLKSPGLDAGALLDLNVSWPPRSWWKHQIDAGEARHETGRVSLTPQGLVASIGDDSQSNWRPLRWRTRFVPEKRLWSIGQTMYRRARRVAGVVWRRCCGKSS